MMSEDQKKSAEERAGERAARRATRLAVLRGGHNIANQGVEDAIIISETKYSDEPTESLKSSGEAVDGALGPRRSDKIVATTVSGIDRAINGLRKLRSFFTKDDGEKTRDEEALNEREAKDARDQLARDELEKQRVRNEAAQRELDEKKPEPETAQEPKLPPEPEQEIKVKKSTSEVVGLTFADRVLGSQWGERAVDMVSAGLLLSGTALTAQGILGLGIATFGAGAAAALAAPAALSLGVGIALVAGFSALTTKQHRLTEDEKEQILRDKNVANSHSVPIGFESEGRDILNKNIDNIMDTTLNYFGKKGGGALCLAAVGSMALGGAGLMAAPILGMGAAIIGGGIYIASNQFDKSLKNAGREYHTSSWRKKVIQDEKIKYATNTALSVLKDMNADGGELSADAKEFHEDAKMLLPIIAVHLCNNGQNITKELLQNHIDQGHEHLKILAAKCLAEEKANYSAQGR